LCSESTDVPAAAGQETRRRLQATQPYLGCLVCQETGERPVFPRAPQGFPSGLGDFHVFHPVLQDWIKELKLCLLCTRDNEGEYLGLINLQSFFVCLVR